MTPIIPPIWLYLFEVLESFDSLLLAINIVSIAVIVVYAISLFAMLCQREKPLQCPRNGFAFLFV